MYMGVMPCIHMQMMEEGIYYLFVLLFTLFFEIGYLNKSKAQCLGKGGGQWPLGICLSLPHNAGL